MRIDGKVALVTGAASGIGHAIAKRYVAAGGRVVIADLNLDAASAAAREVADAKTAIAVAMDVANEQQVNASVGRTIAAFGKVDILVSNGGIQIVHPIEDFPFSDWKKLIAIHLDGAFLATKACVKHMYRQGSGSLIYMGSVHSHEGSPLKSAYVAAKHGILGFARTTAKEGAKHGDHGRGHRRNCPLGCRVQDQRADRRKLHRQPWLAHELGPRASRRTLSAGDAPTNDRPATTASP
jgi:3-hydroxybutyrate dehydrogenase